MTHWYSWTERCRRISSCRLCSMSSSIYAVQSQVMNCTLGKPCNVGSVCTQALQGSLLWVTWCGLRLCTNTKLFSPLTKKARVHRKLHNNYGAVMIFTWVFSMTIVVRGVEIVAITRWRGADCSSRRGRQGRDNIDVGMQLDRSVYRNHILSDMFITHTR